jgi:phage FluMu protein Com
MAICPKCKKKIDVLRTELTATTGASLKPDGNFIADESLIKCCEYKEYRCPECGKMLFKRNEKLKAERFLLQALL